MESQQNQFLQILQIQQSLQQLQQQMMKTLPTTQQHTIMKALPEQNKHSTTVAGSSTDKNSRCKLDSQDEHKSMYGHDTDSKLSSVTKSDQDIDDYELTLARNALQKQIALRKSPDHNQLQQKFQDNNIMLSNTDEEGNAELSKLLPVAYASVDTPSVTKSLHSRTLPEEMEEQHSDGSTEYFEMQQEQSEIQDRQGKSHKASVQKKLEATLKRLKFLEEQTLMQNKHSTTVAGSSTDKNSRCKLDSQDEHKSMYGHDTDSKLSSVTKSDQDIDDYELTLARNALQKQIALRKSPDHNQLQQKFQDNNIMLSNTDEEGNAELSKLLPVAYASVDTPSVTKSLHSRTLPEEMEEQHSDGSTEYFEMQQEQSEIQDRQGKSHKASVQKKLEATLKRLKFLEEQTLMQNTIMKDLEDAILKQTQKENVTETAQTIPEAANTQLPSSEATSDSEPEAEHHVQSVFGKSQVLQIVMESKQSMPFTPNQAHELAPLGFGSTQPGKPLQETLQHTESALQMYAPVAQSYVGPSQQVLPVFELEPPVTQDTESAHQAIQQLCQQTSMYKHQYLVHASGTQGRSPAPLQQYTTLQQVVSGPHQHVPNLHMQSPLGQSVLEKYGTFIPPHKKASFDQSQHGPAQPMPIQIGRQPSQQSQTQIPGHPHLEQPPHYQDMSSSSYGQPGLPPITSGPSVPPPPVLTPPNIGWPPPPLVPTTPNICIPPACRSGPPLPSRPCFPSFRPDLPSPHRHSLQLQPVPGLPPDEPNIKPPTRLDLQTHFPGSLKQAVPNPYHIESSPPPPQQQHRHSLPPPQQCRQGFPPCGSHSLLPQPEYFLSPHSGFFPSQPTIPLQQWPRPGPTLPRFCNEPPQSTPLGPERSLEWPICEPLLNTEHTSQMRFQEPSRFRQPPPLSPWKPNGSAEGPSPIRTITTVTSQAIQKFRHFQPRQLVNLPPTKKLKRKLTQPSPVPSNSGSITLNIKRPTQVKTTVASTIQTPTSTTTVSNLANVTATKTVQSSLTTLVGKPSKECVIVSVSSSKPNDLKLDTFINQSPTFKQSSASAIFTSSDYVKTQLTITKLTQTIANTPTIVIPSPTTAKLSPSAAKSSPATAKMSTIKTNLSTAKPSSKISKLSSSIAKPSPSIATPSPSIAKPSPSIANTSTPISKMSTIKAKTFLAIVTTCPLKDKPFSSINTEFPKIAKPSLTIAKEYLTTEKPSSTTTAMSTNKSEPSTATAKVSLEIANISSIMTQMSPARAKPPLVPRNSPAIQKPSTSTAVSQTIAKQASTVAQMCTANDTETPPNIPSSVAETSITANTCFASAERSSVLSTATKKSPTRANPSPKDSKLSPSIAKPSPSIAKQSPPISKMPTIKTKTSKMYPLKAKPFSPITKESPAIAKSSPTIAKESPTIEKPSPTTTTMSTIKSELSTATAKVSLEIAKISSTMICMSPAIVKPSLVPKKYPAIRKPSTTTAKMCTTIANNTVIQTSPKVPSSTAETSITANTSFASAERSSMLLTATKDSLTTAKPSLKISKLYPSIEKPSASIAKPSPPISKMSTIKTKTFSTIAKTCPLRANPCSSITKESLTIAKPFPTIPKESPTIEKPFQTTISTMATIKSETSTATAYVSLEIANVSSTMRQMSPAKQSLVPMNSPVIRIPSTTKAMMSQTITKQASTIVNMSAKTSPTVKTPLATAKMASTVETGIVTTSKPANTRSTKENTLLPTIKTVPTTVETTSAGTISTSALIQILPQTAISVVSTGGVLMLTDVAQVSTSPLLQTENTQCAVTSLKNTLNNTITVTTPVTKVVITSNSPTKLVQSTADEARASTIVTSCSNTLSVLCSVSTTAKNIKPVVISAKCIGSSCSRCGNEGHSRANCPVLSDGDKNKDTEKLSRSDDEQSYNDGKQSIAQLQASSKECKEKLIKMKALYESVIQKGSSPDNDRFQRQVSVLVLDLKKINQQIRARQNMLHEKTHNSQPGRSSGMVHSTTLKKMKSVKKVPEKSSSRQVHFKSPDNAINDNESVLKTEMTERCKNDCNVKKIQLAANDSRSCKTAEELTTTNACEKIHSIINDHTKVTGGSSMIMVHTNEVAAVNILSSLQTLSEQKTVVAPVNSASLGKRTSSANITLPPEIMFHKSTHKDSDESAFDDAAVDGLSADEDCADINIDRRTNMDIDEYIASCVVNEMSNEMTASCSAYHNEHTFTTDRGFALRETARNKQIYDNIHKTQNDIARQSSQHSTIKSARVRQKSSGRSVSPKRFESSRQTMQLQRKKSTFSHRSKIPPRLTHQSKLKPRSRFSEPQELRSHLRSRSPSRYRLYDRRRSPYQSKITSPPDRATHVIHNLKKQDQKIAKKGTSSKSVWLLGDNQLITRDVSPKPHLGFKTDVETIWQIYEKGTLSRFIHYFKEFLQKCKAIPLAIVIHLGSNDLNKEDLKTKDFADVIRGAIRPICEQLPGCHIVYCGVKTSCVVGECTVDRVCTECKFNSVAKQITREYKLAHFVPRSRDGLKPLYLCLHKILCELTIEKGQTCKTMCCSNYKWK